MSEWINVSDRLPESDKGRYVRCLVNVNGFGVRVDRFMLHATEKQWFDYYGYVTHWQPLPSPPRINNE
jgi:hypothetical protein